jgi:hypothetical protein
VPAKRAVPRGQLKDRTVLCIRSLTSEIKGEDAASLPSIIENVTKDTPYTEKAAGRLKGILAKVGKSTYDLAIEVQILRLLQRKNGWVFDLPVVRRAIACT